MWKGFGCALLCLAVVQAAVIRPEADPEVPETTTSVVIADQEGEFTTEESTTQAAPALSRDEEASILIDPAPGTLHEDGGAVQEKSGKLLLLSTPPKRGHEVERQLEEQDDEGEDSKADGEPTTTEQPKESDEQREELSPESPTAESSTTPATTKLFAVDATPAGVDSPPPTVAISLSQDNANETVSIAEQPQVPGDNNAAVELALVEPEAEYVLVDMDVDGGHDDLDLQLASFTHIDSDVHLQPVVHSVEIVPTSLDDPLIVNYVHNLR
ncbi:nucleolin [Drosophila gunungcola]|uniref:Uncharacterized protein n=1 Tax=Drosophila gunungcola TaxID=103775 RepID=A0A9P9YJH3_9MUSC|nr:nucleolin [Drosophila gunungcola]KAI8037769.1 hypothetical protein M5D96_009270 [Drosophila gunungcola]